MTDGESVRRALQGDAAAFGELARCWSARVLAFCRAKCGNRHVAEDLAQETLLRGLRTLSTLESPERIGPWLRGIARHVYLDWRKAKQTAQIPFSMLSPDGGVDQLLARDAESCVEQEDDARRLMQEIEMLDEDYRETLMLYYSHDMTYVQLAALLDVSPATINMRLTKARAALRARLVPPDDGGHRAGSQTAGHQTLNAANAPTERS
ncbi:MAG: RNA polymerase sigma factor [Candidatus Saccharimonas sp.]|nr:RNA polymerase sigma factor [Planctomycetaceae bacterium]